MNKWQEVFKKEGYELLTKDYINAKQKVAFICPNGHEHTIRLDHWKRGVRCGKCTGRHKTIEDIRTLFNKNGYKLLSTKYKNPTTKLKFICPKGHKHSMTWNDWRSGNRCGVCAGKHITIEEVKEAFIIEGYELITKVYEKNNTLLDFICPKGHKHSITWSDWRRGNRCGVCAGSHKKDIDYIKTVFESENYQLISNEYKDAFTKMEYICPNGHKRSIIWNNWQQGNRCSVCNHIVSKPELDIVALLKDITIKTSDRQLIKPYELDIVIPEKKVAIEYCGLYWHSESRGKDSKYHLNKLIMCEDIGYRLITIFDDEWVNHRDVVISRINNAIGMNNKKSIHARKCDIKEINNTHTSPFLNSYHLQGAGKSAIKLGAFYDNELVSIMTFSKPSISKGANSASDFWELNRFCSHPMYHVPGVASKLLTYFERNYEWSSIISYADRRWSDGNLYNKLGFTLIGPTRPNYWYMQSGYVKRLHRFALRKKPDEPKDKTEWQLRQEQGYDRIWDCGSLKFEKQKYI